MRSALFSGPGGITIPTSRAVLRLKTNSRLVTTSTGRSPRTAPFRILSAWADISGHVSATLVPYIIALCDDRCKLSPSPSWPGLTRPSTRCRWCVDGRVKPGHDGTEESVQGVSGIRPLESACPPGNIVGNRFLAASSAIRILCVNGTGTSKTSRASAPSFVIAANAPSRFGGGHPLQV
jgi:hypothetical protein